MSLAIHEARVLGRRGIWAAALAIHAISASLFVALWMPTGGVPLWQATVLEQLAAADRLLVAALVTWLSTFVLADEETGGRAVTDWSALTGLPARSIVRARIAAAAMMTLVLASVALPAFVAAAGVSAATTTELTGHLGSALGFACFCLGVTSVASVSVRDRVAVWCVSMTVCVLAAVGVRALDGAILRGVAPAVAGVALLALAPGALRFPRPSNVR